MQRRHGVARRRTEPRRLDRQSRQARNLKRKLLGEQVNRTRGAYSKRSYVTGVSADAAATAIIDPMHSSGTSAASRARSNRARLSPACAHIHCDASAWRLQTLVVALILVLAAAMLHIGGAPGPAVTAGLLAVAAGSVAGESRGGT